MLLVFRLPRCVPICADQTVAYTGMDIQIKESGQWKGKAKLSKRGSGLLRQILYVAPLRSIH